MKRMKYVDNDGNTTSIAFESKKPFLYFLLAINIGIPLILFGLIIYKISVNNTCNKVYENIERSAKAYGEELGELPAIEGEYTTVSIGDLYSEQYLKSIDTNDALCSGTVKIMKYGEKYLYTIETNNCNKCSTSKKYSGWSAPQKNYPKGRAIVEAIPYYNYYELEHNTTEWSKYYDDVDLADEVSEYGIKLPLDEEKLPKVPLEAEISDIESETTYYYRYFDKKWKWYDQELDYSEFSSEKPEGYENKDTDVSITTEWSEYSQNHPGEKSYRTIEKATGYKFYYLNKDNEKVYYNNGKYTAKAEVNSKKYDKRDEETAVLYRYRDKKWRWYNGQKRKYSIYSKNGSERTPLKDAQTEIVENPTGWSIDRKIDDQSKEYRIEEKKLMTRFRIKYDIVSLLALKKPVVKERLEEIFQRSIREIAADESIKLAVTYEYRYRK